MIMTFFFSFIAWAAILIMPTRLSSGAKPDLLRHEDIHTKVNQEIARKLGPVSDECWNEWAAIQEDPTVVSSLSDDVEDFNFYFLPVDSYTVEETDNGERIWTIDFSLILEDTQSNCESIGGQYVRFTYKFSLDSDKTYIYQNMGWCIGVSCNAADFAYELEQYYAMDLGPFFNITFFNQDNSTGTPTSTPTVRPIASVKPTATPTVSFMPSVSTVPTGTSSSFRASITSTGLVSLSFFVGVLLFSNY